VEPAVDAKRILEENFVVGRGLGPFFIPFSPGETKDTLVTRAEARIRDIWPRQFPAMNFPVYIRVFSWEKEKPRIGDGMLPITVIGESIVDAFVRASAIRNSKQVGGIWVMRDHYSMVPYDLLSVQIVWGV